jgi:predicted nucleotidyltransferase
MWAEFDQLSTAVPLRFATQMIVLRVGKLLSSTMVCAEAWHSDYNSVAGPHMSPQEEVRLKLPQIREICRRYYVRELSLFGSALGSDFRSDSDYDLLVEFQPEAPVGLFACGRMVVELEKLFQRKIDLVFKSGLKTTLRSQVLDQAQILYAQP